jgi:phosphomannomutase
VFVDDPRKTERIFARLRNEGHYWARMGHLRITAIRDLTGVGYDTESTAVNNKPKLPTSSGSHMITYRFSNGVVATLRTSGTEPKLKWYSELRGTDPAATRAELAATIDLMLDEMLQPELHGLKRPKKD